MSRFWFYGYEACSESWWRPGFLLRGIPPIKYDLLPVARFLPSRFNFLLDGVGASCHAARHGLAEDVRKGAKRGRKEGV